MQYIYQFGLILFISFLGEMIYLLVPLPIPASIYGLLAMLFCLKTKVIKLEKVKQAGDYLLEIMPLLFIAPGVGILTVLEEVRDILLPLMIIVLLTTILVMVVTGKVTQLLMNKGEGDE